MNTTASGQFAKRYYVEVLANPNAAQADKDKAAAGLVHLEDLRNKYLRDNRIKRLQRQLVAAQARIAELEVQVPKQERFNTLREQLGLPPHG
jgi:hypothetical protein